MNIDFPVSLFLNLSLVCCWFFYLLRFQLKTINLLVLSIVFANSSISLAVFICGLIGILTPIPVTIFTFALPIILFISNLFFSNTRDSFYKNLINLGIRIKNQNFNNFGSLLICILFILGIYIVFLASILPADGFDSFIYHYTIPAQWIEQGSFARLAGPRFHGLFYWLQYPAGMELTFAWHLLFQGNDFWIEAAGWSYWILGVLTVYAWLKSLKASYNISLIGAAIWGITPLVVTQQLGGYIDASLSTQVLVTSYLGYKFLKSDEVSLLYLVAAVLAFAWIPGIKGSGLVFAIFIVVLWSMIYLENYFLHDKKLHIKWVAIFYGSCFIAVLVLSGYWYFRNYFDYGNPFYPFKFSLFGLELFSGRPHTTWISWPEGEPLTNFYLAFHEKLAATWNENYPCWFFGESRGGFGPLISVIMPVFFPIGLLWIVLKKRFSLILGFAFGSLLFYATSPAIFPRYALPLLGYYLIISIAALHYLKPRVLINMVILLVFIYHFLNLFALNWNSSKAIFSGLENPRQGSAEFNFGKQYKMFNKIVPQDAVVAYDHIYDPYHLISPHLDRKLVYSNHRGGYFNWLSSLNKNNADYFIYGYKKEGFRLPYLWALNSKFMILGYEDDNIAVFKIKKEKLEKYLDYSLDKASKMLEVKLFEDEEVSLFSSKTRIIIMRIVWRLDSIKLIIQPEFIEEKEESTLKENVSSTKIDNTAEKSIEKTGNTKQEVNSIEKQKVSNDELKHIKSSKIKSDKTIQKTEPTN